MGTLYPKWTPNWWNNNYEMSWERVKEAFRRDLEQTKFDLHAGGHQLNQEAGDTVSQATGAAPIPDINHLNPPRVIGSWDDAEGPIGFGYGARMHYGANHPSWSADLESKLEKEWDEARKATGRAWSDVKSHVRHGYETTH